MSQEQPLQSRAVAGRQQIRIRFDKLKRSSGLRVIGVPELIGLSVAALLALLTIFAYLYFLAPAHSRLTSRPVGTRPVARTGARFAGEPQRRHRRARDRR